MSAKRFNKKKPIPDILTLLKFLLKRKLVGFCFIVIGIINIPGIITLPVLLETFSDSAIKNIGIMSYMISMLMISIGLILYIKEYKWFKLHMRHIFGLSLLLVFFTGLLGMLSPNLFIDSVNLQTSSLTGDFGKYMNEQTNRKILWLLSFIFGFLLVWPYTSLLFTQKIYKILKIYITFKNCSIFFRYFFTLLSITFKSIKFIIQKTAYAVSTLFPSENIEEILNSNIENESDKNTDEEYPIRPKAILEKANTENIDKSIKNESPKKIKQIKMDFESSVSEWRHTPDGWQLPPLDVLTETLQNTNEKVNNEARARLIINTLSSFGVDAKVVEINEGPTVTQFGVEPGWDVKEKISPQLDSTGIQLIDKKGEPLYKKEIISRTRIRVNRITALQNDLALALATPSLRIEAPVPGKPIVGIEVPNSLNSIVNLKNLIDNQKFHSFKEKNNLPVALGQGVSGEPLLIDLAKMPHLLIAGATGSGKSVCLSGIISCLLMNHSPSELRFILIDPKRVELTQFAKIPHLAFSEIVVDTDKVVSTLRAVINEMENRYKRFGSLKVRNIQTYNEKFPDDPLPYWVVIVDELADLMLSASFEVETQLVRLAQLARATGIHLIIATQRPSVDVITGLIKANFPTRIAFAVTSQIDSRTIIDYAGAEKLLGRGDMLFLSPNAQKPKRIQGVYVDDSEIEKIVHFWTDDKFEEMKPEKQDHLIVEAVIANQEIKNNRDHKTDDLYPDAITLISELETVSVSLLQRKLRIGYPRAARLMDELEENNKVSPSQKGQNLRKVIKDNSSNNLDNSKLEDNIAEPESNISNDYNDSINN